MKIERFNENPLITPADVKPLHEGYEVIGAFNGGVAKYNDEVLLLLRVAERPISDDLNVIKAPVFDPRTQTKGTYANMRQNILIAVGVVIILLVSLIFSEWMSMSIGMLVHEASILVVILNAMRLRRYQLR